MKRPLLQSIPGRPLLTAIAATLLATSVARADVESVKLTLSGFTDAVDAAGAQLAAGDYAAVIDRLAPHGVDFDEDEVAASTNLCVAYVATGQLDEAHDACEEAITMARLEDSGVTLAQHMAHQEALSIAYANRAVLTRLSGE
ncbi:MAG TPA: hypothetical protein VMC02_12800 [Steroidobacteraceae bacterium]|nr:hypothetical protein [Steroidobacteraceae bacterium]